MIDREISKRITSLRFLLAIFVIFIHNNFTAEVAEYYKLSFTEPLIITSLKVLLCTILGSAAVPLFFFFSGYLQFSKEYDYILLLKKRFRSLVVPFVVWTLIVVAIYATLKTIPYFTQFFSNSKEIISTDNYIIDVLKLFTVYENGQPFIGQFWFIRNLIVLVILSPIFSYLAKKNTLIICICVTYCFLKNIPYGIGVSLFFFMAGYFFAQKGISFFYLADKVKWYEVIILLLIILIIKMIYGVSINLYNFDIVLSCLFFLKLSAIIIAHDKIFEVSNYLSNFSFFIYAAHGPLIITALNKISYKVIPLKGIGYLVQFIIPCILCIVICYCVAIILKKIFPFIYSLLSGER